MRTRGTAVVAGGVLVVLLAGTPPPAVAQTAAEPGTVLVPAVSPRPAPMPHVRHRGPRPVPMPEVELRDRPVPMPRAEERGAGVLLVPGAPGRP